MDKTCYGQNLSVPTRSIPIGLRRLAKIIFLSWLTHLCERLPPGAPEPTVFERFRIHPQSNRRVASGHQFSKDTFILIFTIDDAKMPPAQRLLLGRPFGTDKVREFLFCDRS